MLRIGYNDINCVGSGTIYNLFWNNLLYILIGVCIGIFLFVLIKQLQKEMTSSNRLKSVVSFGSEKGGNPKPKGI